MMKRFAAIAMVLLPAACGGSAPPVDNPSKVLNNDGMVKYRCIDNSPPAGHQGPVSPYGGSCVPESSLPGVQPPGTFDYSKGQPPRAVR
jgi:hypothetical protein